MTNTDPQTAALAKLQGNLPPGEFADVQYALKEGLLEWRDENEVLWVTPKGELEAMELTSCGFYPPWLSVADNELEVEIAPEP